MFLCKNKWMAIDFKKSYYVLLCEKVCIIFPLNMHYFTCEFFTELIWNVQALDLLQSEKLFYFFLIFNFGNSAEIGTLTMVWNKKGSGKGVGGLVQHACMYISEPFLNVKAVHFWEVLNFFCFLFPSSILQWASFIYSKQFERIQKYVKFIWKLQYSAGTVH